MTRKYRVASSAMILKITGTLDPRFFCCIAKKIVNMNTRKSAEHVFAAVSTTWAGLRMTLTHHIRGRYLYMRSLGLYAGQIGTGDMRRGVSVANVGLHRHRKADSAG